jgi:hypothetical protein
LDVVEWTEDDGVLDLDEDDCMVIGLYIGIELLAEE